MITNYLKIAWRNLVNNKVYSAINIFGLATGMAVALIIALWAYKEYSYDKFLPGYEQAYEVKRNYHANGEILTFNTTSLKLADALRNNIPEIEYVAESDWMGPHGLVVGDRKLYVNGGMTGGDFLKIFSFPLIDGKADQVLKEPYSIVLTQSIAKALFDTEDAVGKIVKIDNQYDLKVTGVLKDLPANTTFQFRFLVPFAFLEQTRDNVKEARKGGFGWNSYQQFIKLREGADLTKLLAKIKDIEKGEESSDNAKRSDVILQAYHRKRLYSEYENGVEAGGFIQYVRIFSIVGALVLLIACINFVNLTTARSAKRGREVGIRKAIGSARSFLVLQFLTESFLLTLMAFVVAMLLVLIALPGFNAISGNQLHIPFTSPIFWLVSLGGVLLTGLMAGSRPAFYLSSFNPVKTLKGVAQSGRSASFSRKVLVVTQFSCSVALIISTMVVYRQIQYAKDRPTGFSASQLLITNTNKDLAKNYTALEDDLLRSGMVQSVTSCSSPATGVEWHSDVDQWPGKYPDETVEMGVVMVDKKYFQTLGMQLQSGRNFTGVYGTDTNDVIFNEAAIRRMRLKDPLNQVVNFQGSHLRIIGVAKDALLASPYSAAEPMMFAARNEPSGYILYRLANGVNPHTAIEKLTSIFERYSPAIPYRYSFVDDDYNTKFQREVLMGRLSGILALLAIVISCLGLFGLAAYVAEQRTKEIGVRKVLGASIIQVWVLLSKDFVWLVVISCCIATPAALYFLQHWLEQYTYRITIGPWVFIGAAVMALGITLITVSFQSVKAALADPVKSLRSE